jgi:glucose/mannose-6-phosphate isomerase
MNNTLALDSLKLLGEQITDSLKQAEKFKLPKTYQKINKIVVSGMGGSNLGGRILSAVFDQELKLPILINADYEVPRWVDSQTLFVISSYSGSTEETVHAYAEAKKKKAKIVVLTGAEPNSAKAPLDKGKNPLIALATKDNFPCLSFTPAFNPSAQPRLAIGYAVTLLAVILNQAGAIKLSAKELTLVAGKLKTWGAKLIPEKSDNVASKLADKLFGKNIVIISGGFLAGNAHTLRNQFNENSKNFACYLTLPELNHYALEGLSWPKSNVDNLSCIFFESSLYSPRVAKRLELTKQVMAKNKIKTLSASLKGATKLEQSLEMLQLGSWITYYLAEKNKVNPLAIPWVDWFKKELK